MALDATPKPEAVSEERIRSIVYSSFDLSQGLPDLQQDILARVFTKHPKLRVAFVSLDLKTDPIMQDQLENKIAKNHIAFTTGLSTESHIEYALNDVQDKLQNPPPSEAGQEYLVEIVAQMIKQDIYYQQKGRDRFVQGEHYKVFKSYLIEHALAKEPYRGDVVLQELFTDIGAFLAKYHFSEHDNHLGLISEAELQKYFSDYNEQVKNGTYTNKDCKEVDLGQLPLFK